MNDSPSALQNWNRFATVRVTPRRVLQCDAIRDKIFFPRDLVPFLRNERVHQCGDLAIRGILVRRLYRFLDATVAFEQDFVNPVARDIAQGDTPFAASKDMRLDALKIYCDEGYHALVSMDLKHQIQELTGVPAPVFTQVPFRRRLADIASTVPDELRTLLPVLFAIISEASMSIFLGSIPRDTEVVAGVREVVADHAKDEGWHYTYFTRLLPLVWAQIGEQERRVIAPALARLVLAYFQPDPVVVASDLTDCGLNQDEIRVVIDDVYSEAAIANAVRGSVPSTIRLFARSGILEHRYVVDEFRANGFLV